MNFSVSLCSNRERFEQSLTLKFKLVILHSERTDCNEIYGRSYSLSKVKKTFSKSTFSVWLPFH